MNDGPMVFEHPRLILCEGPEDVSFFRALIESRGIQHFHVQYTGKDRHSTGGNSKFCEKLRALRLNRSFKVVEKVLIVTDSDDDSGASFAAVAAQITAAGYIAPQAPWTLANGSPAVALITIPDGVPGNLECYLGDAARVTDANKAAFVDHLVGGVATTDEWTDPRKGKLWLRAMMAVRWPRDPGINITPMFRDVEARRIVPTEHHSFNALVNYLAQF